ncbi:MAG: SAM-dependent methyltransferase, partial [Cyanobacteriota bacterium]
RSLAWRLARLCRDLPLGEGPAADLGAGSGLLSRALVRQLPRLRQRPPLQLDLCPELLAHNPLLAPQEGAAATAKALIWDLNRGLPSGLDGCSLLVSGFALQWLDDPARQLRHWGQRLAPGGWLALTVPTQGSFPQWHQAAQEAGVPCTALDLPAAPALIAAAEAQLTLHSCQLLRFSRPAQGGLGALRHLQQLGATASRGPRLSTPQMRRLLHRWSRSSALTWEILLLLAHRP